MCYWKVQTRPVSLCLAYVMDDVYIMMTFHLFALVVVVVWGLLNNK